MTVEEYIEYLKEAFKPNPNLNQYLSDGSRYYWNKLNPAYEQGKDFPLIDKNSLRNHYDRCFQNACHICQSNVDTSKLVFIDLHTNKYDASTKKLADHNLIVVDSSIYSSFIVYFQCLYFLSFIDDCDEGNIKEILIDEVEFQINCFNQKPILRKTNAQQFVDLAALDEDIILWASISAECLLTFLILHEIGHIYLQHDSLRQEMGKKTYFEVYKKECELEADSFANKKLFELLEADNHLMKITLDFINVPYLFFKFLRFIDSYSMTKLGNKTFVPSHYPKLEQRYSNIGYNREYGYQLFEKPKWIIDDLMVSI